MPKGNNGLTDFVTEEDVVSSVKSRIPTSRDKSPYEDQTPRAILSRERLAFQKTYTTAETSFFYMYSPLEWAGSQAVSGCLSTFRYMRWKEIQYRIVLQTNPFIYGYLAATCLPHDERRQDPNTGVTPATFIDYGWYSYDDCVIIDLASMPETIIKVPWLFSSTWVDLEKWLPDEDPDLFEVTRMAGLKLMYGNTCKSTSSSIPKTFSVSVFITFIEPEVSCPISNGFTLQHQAQMLPILAQGAAQVAGSVLSKAAGHLTADAIKAGADAIWGEGEIPQFAEEHLCPLDPNLCSKDPDEGEPTPEEIVPSVFGGMNYSAPRNVLGTGSMGLPSGLGSQNSIIDFIQRPTLVTMTELIAGTGVVVVQSVFDGRNVSDTFGGYVPDCSRLRFMAQFFRFWRGSITYTFMIISSPMVTFRLKIGIDYQGGTLAGVDPGDTLQKIITVRGSTIHQVTIPYIATTPWQYMGDPTILVTRDWSPAISISEFSPASKSGDITPSLFILAFESANRDFMFASQIEPTRDLNPSAFSSGKLVGNYEDRPHLVHEAQMKVAMFRSTDATQFGSCNSVKYAADGVNTIEAMCKRWSPRTNQSLAMPNYFGAQYNLYGPVGQQSTPDYLCAIFYYSRGQYKLKVSFNPGNTVTNSGAMGVMKMETTKNYADAGVDPIIKFCDGTHVISLGLTQVIESTIPYLCTIEWYPCGRNPEVRTLGAEPRRFLPLLYTEGASSVPTNFVAVAAGRDFCFSLSLPPPWTKARWYDTVDYTAPASAQDANQTSPQAASSRVRGKQGGPTPFVSARPSGL